MKLTKAQTRVYESSGPAGDHFRGEAKRAARARANERGKSVEIHSFDGITFEHIEVTSSE